MARGACLARLETEGLAATRPGRERKEMENECILRVGVSECRARDASSNGVESFSRETVPDDVSKVITESQHYVTVCDSRISPSLRPL